MHFKKKKKTSEVWVLINDYKRFGLGKILRDLEPKKILHIWVKF